MRTRSYVGFDSGAVPFTVQAPPRQARVLIAEGDLRQRVELRNALIAGLNCSVRHVACEDEAVHLATTWFPNVILFNPSTMGSDGRSLCRSIENFPELQFTYLIVVSDTQGIEEWSLAPRNIDHDCLVIPCSKVELLARVNCGLRMRDLLHKLSSRNRCLQQFGLVNPTTGLLNSRALAQILIGEQNRARHESKSLALLVGNVEFRHRGAFEVPDGPCREQVMQAVAQVLVDNVRSTDFVAQRSSGEFVVVLLGSDREQAQRACSRLRQLVEQIHIEMQSVRVGVTLRLRELPTGSGMDF
ncbi:MAG: diguanylate cyclase [Chloroflexota bacterium]|mgnify:CR=1 FL=1